MKRTFVLNGIPYIVEEQSQLSSNNHIQREVYHIKSPQEIYPKAKQAIRTIMEEKYYPGLGDCIWSKGEYLLANKNNPILENRLHKYFEFDYDEDLDVYVYVLVTPHID